MTWTQVKSSSEGKKKLFPLVQLLVLVNQTTLQPQQRRQLGDVEFRPATLLEESACRAVPWVVYVTTTIFLLFEVKTCNRLTVCNNSSSGIIWYLCRLDCLTNIFFIL